MAVVWPYREILRRTVSLPFVPVHINDSYREILKSFFTEVKDLSISYLAVDLRNNAGGNSQVINEFLRSLDVERYAVVGVMDVRYGPVLWHFKRRMNKNRPFEELPFT